MGKRCCDAGAGGEGGSKMEDGAAMRLRSALCRRRSSAECDQQELVNIVWSQFSGAGQYCDIVIDIANLRALLIRC